MWSNSLLEDNTTKIRIEDKIRNDEQLFPNEKQINKLHEISLVNALHDPRVEGSYITAW